MNGVKSASNAQQSNNINNPEVKTIYKTEFAATTNKPQSLDNSLIDSYNNNKKPEQKAYSNSYYENLIKKSELDFRIEDFLYSESKPKSPSVSSNTSSTPSSGVNTNYVINSLPAGTTKSGKENVKSTGESKPVNAPQPTILNDKADAIYDYLLSVMKPAVTTTSNSQKPAQNTDAFMTTKKTSNNPIDDEHLIRNTEKKDHVPQSGIVGKTDIPTVVNSKVTVVTGPSDQAVTANPTTQVTNKPEQANVAPVVTKQTMTQSAQASTPSAPSTLTSQPSQPTKVSLIPQLAKNTPKTQQEKPKPDLNSLAVINIGNNINTNSDNIHNQNNKNSNSTQNTQPDLEVNSSKLIFYKPYF
jgi:hypothetical protein